MTAPVIYWTPTPPNRLPVDPVTGGLAAGVGWWTPGGGSTPGPPPDAAYPVTPGGYVASRLLADPQTPIPTPIPTHYRFACTAAGPGVIELYAVRAGDALSKLSARFFNVGMKRAMSGWDVTPDIPGLAVVVYCPAAYTDPATEADGFSHAAYTDLFGAAVSVSTGLTTAPTPQGFMFSGPVLVQGHYDPGPTPPTSSEDTLGAAVWADLPEMYRTADEALADPLQLLRYLQGAGVGADEVQAVAAMVYNGGLTDLNTCPDEWLPWLAAVIGAPVGPTPDDTRAAIASREGGAAEGSVQSITQFVQHYLTGTKTVTVAPSATPWVLTVSMISGETLQAGGPDVIVGKLVAAGKVPAGWSVNGTVINPTWAAHDAAYSPPWSTWDGQTWAQHESVH